MDYFEKQAAKRKAFVASYADKHLQGVSFAKLVGEEIVKELCGNPLMPKCGSYGAHTLFTKSGKEYIVWNSMGEVNLSQVLENKG